MNYLEYVVAAYAVFALALAWDFIAPRLKIASILRDVRLRAKRETARATQTRSTELQR
jgi:heme exporter protein D